MTPADFKQARIALGLSQAEMAPLLGYGATSRVSEIETGRRQASESVARLLRAYLDGYRPADWPQRIIAGTQADTGPEQGDTEGRKSEGKQGA